jgi:hypothetical protein
VQLLILGDGLQREQDRDRELRLALVASGRVSPADAFPELGRPDEDEDENPAMPSSGADLTDLAWESPGESGALSDMELLQRAMAVNQLVTVREEPDRLASPPQRSEHTSLDYP